MHRRELLQYLTIVLGGAISPSCSRAMMSDTPLHSPVSVKLLDEGKSKQIAILADMIIPRTDTPGAVDAGVPDFIEHIFTHWYSPDERQLFIDGLDALDEYCRKNHQVDFVSADSRQRLAVLEEQQSLSGAASMETMMARSLGASGDPTFFLKLRELIVLGYFTSEAGATKALTYTPLPGKYDGSYLLKDVHSQWSF